MYSNKEKKGRKEKGMALLTFKGGIHPDDGKSLAKDKAIVEVKPKGDLV